MNFYSSVTDLIGKTPLLKVDNLFLKLEFFNPAGSSKDRAAFYMIKSAQQKGIIKKGATLIEATSGNTGIALASVGRALGYKVILTMPENMSVERVNLLKAYGATVVLTCAEKGMQCAIEKALEIKENTENSIILGQFENPANPEIQRNGTGEEIIRQVNGPIHGFCSGIGTGGTITGIGETLRKYNPDMTIWAVEPENAAILSGGSIGTHVQMGIGDGVIPAILNQEVYNDVCIIKDEEAIRVSKELASKEGIMCGISSGTNVAAALKLAKKLGKGKTVVTVLPDTAERYFSTPLFE